MEVDFGALPPNGACVKITDGPSPAYWDWRCYDSVTYYICATVTGVQYRVGIEDSAGNDTFNLPNGSWLTAPTSWTAETIQLQYVPSPTGYNGFQSGILNETDFHYVAKFTMQCNTTNVGLLFNDLMLNGNACTGTPTETPTITVTATQTATATITDTSTLTDSPTPAPSGTATLTLTPSLTGTVTTTGTQTLTSTNTPLMTSTYTVTSTVTPSQTMTLPPTTTPSETATIQPTTTASPTFVTTPAAAGATFIYPSPATGDKANVVYTLSGPGNVKIRVYNDAAQLVETLTEDKQGGPQTSVLNIKNLSTGVYMYILTLTYQNQGTTKIGPKKFMVLK